MASNLVPMASSLLTMANTKIFEQDEALKHICTLLRILYGMRKRRLRPCNFEKKEHQLWAQVLRIVAAFFRQKLHFISPKGIVCILYEFAHHGIFPGVPLEFSTYRGSCLQRSLLSTWVFFSLNLAAFLLPQLVFFVLFLKHQTSLPRPA